MALEILNYKKDLNKVIFTANENGVQVGELELLIEFLGEEDDIPKFEAVVTSVTGEKSEDAVIKDALIKTAAAYAEIRQYNLRNDI